MQRTPGGNAAIRVKSAAPPHWNADGMPSALSTPFMLRPYVMTNFGK